MGLETASQATHAPADHLHPERGGVAQLELHLAALRRQLPGLQRLGSGVHHGLISAAAVIAAMVVCWSINMASASRLASITATIIVLVPRTESPERMFAARIGEVRWGVCVAVLLVWLADRLPAHYARPRGKSGL